MEAGAGDGLAAAPPFPPALLQAAAVKTARTVPAPASHRPARGSTARHGPPGRFSSPVAHGCRSGCCAFRASCPRTTPPEQAYRAQPEFPQGLKARPGPQAQRPPAEKRRCWPDGRGRREVRLSALVPVTSGSAWPRVSPDGPRGDPAVTCAAEPARNGPAPADRRPDGDPGRRRGNGPAVRAPPGPATRPTVISVGRPPKQRRSLTPPPQGLHAASTRSSYRPVKIGGKTFAPRSSESGAGDVHGRWGRWSRSS